jgi:hypothetical protein
MATLISLESGFSNWIDHRGYNFHVENREVLAIGQSALSAGAGSSKNFYTLNAYSVFFQELPENIVSGKLEFYTGIYLSDNPFEKILVYSMDSSVADLLASHTISDPGGLQPEIFMDAQNGVLIGEYVRVDKFPGSMQLIQVDITPEGIEWLNGRAEDAPVAIGFTVEGIGPSDVVSLGINVSPGAAPRLVLDVIPEPSIAGLLGLGVVMLSWVRRRLRSAA